MPYVQVWVDDREALEDVSDNALEKEMLKRSMVIPEKRTGSLRKELIEAWEAGDEREFRDLVDELIPADERGRPLRRDRVRQMYQAWKNDTTPAHVPAAGEA